MQVLNNPTQITKHNVCETIENYLKELKLRYEISEQSSLGCFYEIFISSTPGYIQVEYDLDKDDDTYVIIQFFSRVDDYGNSIYHSDWNNECEDGDLIEGEIDQLIDSVKRVNRGISKISTKINQIRDICDEYELDFDEFITLNYDFDE